MIPTMRIVAKFTHETRGCLYYIWEIHDFSEENKVIAISGEYFVGREAAELNAKQFIQRIKNATFIGAIGRQPKEENYCR